MEKYSRMDEDVCFGFLVNALGKGGDKEEMFPRSDAEDMSRGARFIPGEVTLARRDGRKVVFHQPCNGPCCWYWEFDDGSRNYHYERFHYESTAKANGIEPSLEDEYSPYPNGVGSCPDCGNERMGGGHFKADDIGASVPDWAEVKEEVWRQHYNGEYYRER